jgi:hypothetical protein
MKIFLKYFNYIFTINFKHPIYIEIYCIFIYLKKKVAPYFFFGHVFFGEKLEVTSLGTFVTSTNMTSAHWHTHCQIIHVVIN